MKISVTILTRDSERYLDACLKSLQDFEEIIVLDNGSIDRTLEIASSFPNVRMHKSAFIGFGPLKNLAATLAKNDWILTIDSDEIATQGLIDEIRQLRLEDNAIYSFKRENHYNQKLIKCCGWYPDRVVRLYNKQRTSYEDSLVHESIIIQDNAAVQNLESTLKHYPFENVASLIDKMQRYSTLYAAQHRNKKECSFHEALIRAMFSFLKNYFLQRGCLCGYEGLLISISNANGVFYKYAKLYEENRR